MFVGHRTMSEEFLRIPFGHHSSEFQSLKFTKYVQYILKNDSCIFIYLIIPLSSALSSVQNNITSPCFQHTMLKTFQSSYRLFFFLIFLENSISQLWPDRQSGQDNFLLWIVLIIMGRLAARMLDRRQYYTTSPQLWQPKMSPDMTKFPWGEKLFLV